MVTKILLLLSTATLGIFLGTQIAEAGLIVPFWKGLSEDEFFAYYHINGPKLHQFFAPWTIAATVLPIATLVWQLVTKQRVSILMWIMVLFTLLFFGSFFVFFKEANAAFAGRSFTDAMLPAKLVEWGNWHWGRIVCEAIAFVCGLVLLAKSKQHNDHPKAT